MKHASLILAVTCLVLAVLVAGCGGGGSGPGSPVEAQGTGVKIAFARQVGTAWHIFLMGPLGANQTDLTPGSFSNADPAWSPNHRQIAFTSNRKTYFEVYVMDVSGLNLHRVTFNGVKDSASYTQPAWSPDGTKIVAARTAGFLVAHLYLFHPDGTHMTQLTTGPYADENPTWLPDGSGVLFDSDRQGGRQIFAVDTHGLNLHRLTFTGTVNQYPSCAPEVARVVYTSNRGGDSRLWTMKPDGTDAHVVPNTGGTHGLGRPSWGPGGTALVYRASAATASSPNRLCRINADGAGLTVLTATATDDDWPAWGRVPS